MSDPATRQETGDVARPRAARGPGARRWDRVRLGLVVGWIVVLAALPVVGVKSAEWSDVRELVAAGTVTEVHVDGELPAGFTGFATVAVRWRHGPLDYVAYVRQVRDDHSSDARNSEGVSAILHDPPGAELVSLQPGLRVARGARASLEHSKIVGFDVPAVFAFVPFVLVVLGLAVLLGSPSPWRATPWAWFWWLWHPIGAVAFALLSGPFPGMPAPRRPERRITGGWAFLVMLVVTSLSFTLWGVRYEL